MMENFGGKMKEVICVCGRKIKLNRYQYKSDRYSCAKCRGIEIPKKARTYADRGEVKSVTSTGIAEVTNC